MTTTPPEQSTATEVVKIEKLIYGGDGLSRTAQGQVLFVSGALPGEEVEVSYPSPPPKGPIRATLEGIEAPSPQREIPNCWAFGTCGGCQWQHIDIATQRHWKREIVLESLTRLGKLQNVTVNPCIGDEHSTQQWHYRNKATWFVADELPYQLGYYKERSHDVATFDHCWIIPDRLNQLKQAIESQFNEEAISWPAMIHRLEARIAIHDNYEESKILLYITMRDDEPLPDQELLEKFMEKLNKRFPDLAGAVFRTVTSFQSQEWIWGVPELHVYLRGKRYQVSAGSFFQINPTVSAKMMDYVEVLLKGKARLKEPEKPLGTLLDLYGGVGVFGIRLADQAESVTIMETLDTAVGDAISNCFLNNCRNVFVIGGSAAQELHHLTQTFETAIIDPPRSGCDQAVTFWMTEHIQHQAVYISCDPTTLARDLGHWVKAGWQIDSVQPFDMFPHTHHIETVVHLLKPAEAF